MKNWMGLVVVGLLAHAGASEATQVRLVDVVCGASIVYKKDYPPARYDVDGEIIINRAAVTKVGVYEDIYPATRYDADGEVIINRAAVTKTGTSKRITSAVINCFTIKSNGDVRVLVNKRRLVNKRTEYDVITEMERIENKLPDLARKQDAVYQAAYYRLSDLKCACAAGSILGCKGLVTSRHDSGPMTLAKDLDLISEDRCNAEATHLMSLFNN